MYYILFNIYFLKITDDSSYKSDLNCKLSSTNV